MTKIYDSSSEISVAQDIAASDVVYKSYARANETMESVNSQLSTFEILVPFQEGIIRRVIMFKDDDSNSAQYSNLTLSESAQLTKLNKILEYAQIDFSTRYLDSEEEIYFSTTESKIYAHVNVDGNYSTDLVIRLDIQKVN